MNTPGYQTAPGYGTAPYSPTAGYGQVAMANQDQWAVRGAPPWPLVLSDGAKKLVALFIGLGPLVIVGVAILAVAVSSATQTSVNRSLDSLGQPTVSQGTGAGSGNGSGGTGGTQVTKAVAFHRTEAAFEKLGRAMSAYASAEGACASGDLTCVTKGALGAQKAFAAMAGTMRSMTMPTAESRAASAAFLRDLHQGHTFFHSLSGATTASQYLDRATRFPLTAFTKRLSTDYGKLIVAIEG
jgi:hypothetical protein